MHIQNNMSNFATANPIRIWLHRGVEQLVARQAHNLEVACSSPASATKQAVIRLLWTNYGLNIKIGRTELYKLENWYSHKSLVLNVKYIANHVGITQSKHRVLFFCVMILHTILWLYMQSEGTISPYRQNKLLTIIVLIHNHLKTNKKIGKPTRDFPI